MVAAASTTNAKSAAEMAQGPVTEPIPILTLDARHHSNFRVPTNRAPAKKICAASLIATSIPCSGSSGIPLNKWLHFSKDGGDGSIMGRIRYYLVRAKDVESPTE